MISAGHISSRRTTSVASPLPPINGWPQAEAVFAAIQQVHGLMEVLDLMTQRYLAEVRNDFEERLASGNSTRLTTVPQTQESPPRWRAFSFGGFCLEDWLRGQDLLFSVPLRRLCLLAGP